MQKNRLCAEKGNDLNHVLSDAGSRCDLRCTRSQKGKCCI